MKYILNVISISLVVIWVMVYWGTNAFQTIDLLLVMAGLIMLVRIFFNKQLTRKKEDMKKQNEEEINTDSNVNSN